MIFCTKGGRAGTLVLLNSYQTLWSIVLSFIIFLKKIIGKLINEADISKTLASNLNNG